MVSLQRKLAAQTPMLMDGRDICTVVLPDAPVKIFLTASAEERARRRWLEMTQKGDNTPYETVLADLRARDAQDMNREVAPLKKADDAIVVDTSTIGFEESFQVLCELVVKELAIELED